MPVPWQFQDGRHLWDIPLDPMAMVIDISPAKLKLQSPLECQKSGHGIIEVWATHAGLKTAYAGSLQRKLLWPQAREYLFDFQL